MYTNLLHPTVVPVLCLYCCIAESGAVLDMGIPTELVGSLPRPTHLQKAFADYDAGKISHGDLVNAQDLAVRDSLFHLAATGEPLITDGEQRASSFATYPVTDTLGGTGPAENLAADGQYFAIFDDGHHRQLPRLTKGPFKYKTYAYENFRKSEPLSAWACNEAGRHRTVYDILVYPLNGDVEGYSREQFEEDLVDECEKDIRGCFQTGAKRVSIDFTEGRLASKNDERNPWTGKGLLEKFIELNNRVLGKLCLVGSQIEGTMLDRWIVLTSHRSLHPRRTQ